MLMNGSGWSLLSTPRPQAPSSRSRPRRATSGSRSTFCHGPAHLRVEPTALKFIKDIFDATKVVAAVCHAPWLLIETGIAKGRRMTSFKSIKADVTNAGAKWEDTEVVVDQGIITSRNPDDL